MSSHRLPPLNALKTFEVYGRHLNMRLAAEELSVTESAISRQIKLIEGFLGAKLFEKVGRSTKFSDKGAEYHSLISRHIAEINSGTNLMFPAVLSPSQSQKIVIGVPSSIAEHWLLPRLSNFVNHHPDAELEIHINDGGDNDLPLEQLDLEITDAILDAEDYPHTKLHRIHDFPVCSPALLNSFGGDGVQLLQKATKLHERSYHWWPAWLSQKGFEGDFKNKGPLLFNENLPIKMSLLGQGVALGDHLTCEGHLQTAKLVRPVDALWATNDWVLVVERKKIKSSALVKKFKAWLIDEMTAFNKSLSNYQG